jgi:hypothetical protein
MTRVCVALFAVVAVSAIVVTSSAAGAVVFLLAEWLVNGNSISETLLALGEGEVLLENKNAPVIKKPASLTCSGGGVGSVGVDGADEITELLTLTETLVSATPLSGTGFSCIKGVGDEVCEAGSKVWPTNLPWLTRLMLWEEGGVTGFVDLLAPHTGGGNLGWYIECKTPLVTLSEECAESESAVEERNVTGGVESIDSEAFTLLMELKLGLCTGNNEETGVLAGSGGLISLPGGGNLTVSSEG